MKLQEKLKYLQDNHLEEWLNTRQETESKLSNNQSTFCICGRLATGLHESHCSKFRNKVTRETLRKLEPLLTNIFLTPNK